MCLDMGHANLYEKTKNDYIAYLDRLDKSVDIGHLHIHENWGDRDSHLTIFTGPAGENDAGLRLLMKKMMERQFSGSIVLEQWPQPAEQLVMAKQRLEKLLDDLGSIGNEARTLSSGDGLDTDGEGGFEGKNENQMSAAVGHLVNINREFGSWRKRLHSMTEERPFQSDVDEDLSHFFVYLKLLALGQVPCSEDGGHHRPNHVAKAAQKLLIQLSDKVSLWGEWRLRRLTSWLPSFDASFTCAEPLTRIRDLAHRNDIDQTLKREIKTTLQNKLHRSAGPEDLFTAECFLKRFESGADHVPEGFLSDYRIFLSELRDFFGVASLRDLLLKNQHLGVSAFMDWLNDPRDLCEGCVVSFKLRRQIREQVVDFSCSSTQSRVLLDHALEQCLFARLSTDIAHQFSGVEVTCRALEQLLPHLGLSGVSQVVAVGSCPQYENAPATLAWLQRVVLCCEVFASELVSNIQPVADELCPALGCPDHVRETFSEAEVRGHLVFQVSKLASLAEARMKVDLGWPEADAIATGTAVGEAVCLEHLSEAKRGEAKVVWLEQLEGDEAITSDIKGIVVGRSVPRLSHIAIRARQQGVVMLSLPKQRFEELKSWLGKSILLTLSASTFSIEDFEKSDLDSQGVNQGDKDIEIKFAMVDLQGGSDLLSIEKFDVDRVGAKAQGVAQLKRCAEPLGFSVPRSWALPYAKLQECLVAELGAGETSSLIDQLGRAEVGSQVRQELERRYGALSLPSDPFLALPKEQCYAVRSSSNCEDLIGQSGAGWHSSFLGVDHRELSAVCAKVWGSLWNEAAVEGRRGLGLCQAGAQMAVLIQELLLPDWSFIAHGHDPNHDVQGRMIFELAHGLGEGLSSACLSGQPYVLAVEGESVEVLRYGTFLEKVELSGGGEMARSVLTPDSHEDWSCSDKLNLLGLRLARIMNGLELHWGEHLDVEGCFVNGEIYIVQARPQNV
jgi:phosphoglucan,water dikinase